MPVYFDTPEENYTFLTDKGYLSERFMTATQAGYWFKEFTELYDQCCKNVVSTNAKDQFTMPLYGAYNDWLDKMKLELFYYMKPGGRILSLFMAEASIGDSGFKRDQHGFTHRGRLVLHKT